MVVLSIINHTNYKDMSNNNINESAEVEFEYTGKGCVVPKDVTIVQYHTSVIEVENEAFDNCKQLRELAFNDGLQKIGGDAFRSCRSLSSIVLPSTVTEIGNGAFNNCSNLMEVVLNEGLQKIGQYAFHCCKSSSSATHPSTVTELVSSAFKNCNNLREVVLNEGLLKIGWNAFWRCSSLSSITRPSTVTEVDNAAFNKCSKLREVVLHGVPWEIGKEAFQYCTSLESFTFPTISTRLNTLTQTGHWEETENEVNEVSGVVERSGGDYFVSAQTMGGGRNWSTLRRDLYSIVRVISRYELKEATSIFELALWKFKLDQVDKANPIPRKKCRMDVPGPVKDIILQYLPYECLRPVSDV